MSKRKLVDEVASGSANIKVKIDGTFLNNLCGDTKGEIEGKLELGPTLLDITKGLELVTRKKNDKDLFKYTIMLYISRGAINNAIQFLEIESELKAIQILEIFLKHLQYRLPGGETLNKKKKEIARDEDFYWLEISDDHAYIYIGDSDGKSYKNNLCDAMDFIYRRDPENRPSLCSIM